MEKVEKTVQKQLEKDPNIHHPAEQTVDPMGPPIKGELPPRSTGRRTGTAKKPTGPQDRLTEEERKKRHKRVVG